MLEGTGASIEDPRKRGFTEGVLGFLASESLRIEVGQKETDRCRQMYAPEIIAQRYVNYVKKSL